MENRRRCEANDNLSKPTHNNLQNMNVSKLNYSSKVYAQLKSACFFLIIIGYILN